MTTETVQFLVEHLPRIGTTSVFVQAAHEPKVVSLGPTNLEIQNEYGYRFSILLPHKIDVSGSYHFVEGTRNEYTLRLRSKKEDVAQYSKRNKSTNFIMTLPEGKWTKQELLNATSFELYCTSCGCSIIDRENCERLNEMPSEFWMELMDYWHCHKPTRPGNEGQSFSYSAKYNSLKPLLNEILIGGSFFLAQINTFNGKVASNGDVLHCIKCSGLLGERTKDNLYKLYKWRLRLRCNGRQDDVFSPEQDVIFTLLNHLKGHSTRYVLLKCENLQMLVWLFAVGIDVTLPNNQIMNKCMKILYRTDSADEIRGNQNIDEAEIKTMPMEHFIQGLENVHNILPSSTKKIDSWNVSYFPIID